MVVMHYKLKHGGTRYKKYIGAGYCPKCQLWGYGEIVITQIGNRELISFKHKEKFYGYELTTSRCFGNAILN